VRASVQKARTCRLSSGVLIHEPHSLFPLEITRAFIAPAFAGWHTRR
jgi:hypothetical protein